MRRLFRLLACLMLAAAPLAATGALASILAGAKPAAATAQAAPAPVEPVAPGDIPIRADTDERLIQDILARAKQPDPSEKLAPALEKLSIGVRNLSDTFKGDDLKSLSATQLTSLDRHWRFYDRELAAWRVELQRITARYLDDATELASRRAVWEATREATASSGIAPALSDQVDVILRQIDATETALSGPLDRQLKLSRRGSSVQFAVDSGRKAVAAAIAYYDRRLLMIDSPPLWQAWRDRPGLGMAYAALASGLGTEAAFRAEYRAANVKKRQVELAAALLLLPMLLLLSRRSRKLVSDDPDLQSSARVLLRPISSWMVLVLVGLLFTEADAPLALHQVALLVALVPVLRLLPSRVYKVLGPWPYIVTALYLVYQLGFLLAGVPLYRRLNLLVLGLVGLGSIVSLLLRRRRLPDGTDAPKVPRAVRAAGWLAAAALVVASVTNIVGNDSLAEMLVGGVLDSGYVGLALYAGATVLGAILKLLLARRGLTRFRVVTQHAGPLLQSLGRLINFSAFAFWIIVVLNEFRLFRPVAGWVGAALTYPLAVGQVSFTLGKVLLFLASVWVAFWIARTLRLVLREDVLPKMDLPRGVGNSIATLSYYAVVTAGLMIALAAAGFRISELAIVIGALGVGIGFGLQNVVNNFVSGLILMFERPIQPGDVIEVSGTSGKVREIGMRATTLATFEGADVVVPNGTLLSEKLVNWTLTNLSRRFDVNVGVAYGSDPKRVLALLEEVARTTPGVASYPAPAVIFSGFGASSLDFGLRVWTNDFDNWVTIRSELTVRVHDALAAAGIEIPFPQRDLHLKSVSLEARAGLEGRGGRGNEA
jgi:potassium-dependent mechanosensitive channel